MAAQTKFHSERTLANPRSENCRKPRIDLIQPNPVLVSTWAIVGSKWCLSAADWLTQLQTMMSSLLVDRNLGVVALLGFALGVLPTTGSGFGWITTLRGGLARQLLIPLAILLCLELFEAFLGFLDGLQPRLATRQLSGQLVATEVGAELFILKLVTRPGCRNYLADLLAESLLLLLHAFMTRRLVLAGVGFDPD
jgi:hypothetical protein